MNRGNRRSTETLYPLSTQEVEVGLEPVPVQSMGSRLGLPWVAAGCSRRAKEVQRASTSFKAMGAEFVP